MTFFQCGIAIGLRRVMRLGEGGDNAMIRWTGVPRVEVAIGVISITIAPKCTGEVDVLQ